MQSNEERGLGKNPHTYKVAPTGDGSLYKWVEYDENGKVVRESAQTWPAEADAEKAMRAIAPSTDIVEVSTLKNINAEDNVNVNLVRPDDAPDERFAGMTPVSRSIDEKNKPENADAPAPGTTAAKATTPRSPGMAKGGKARSAKTAKSSAKKSASRSTDSEENEA